jgi:hypothetical protein
MSRTIAVPSPSEHAPNTNDAWMTAMAWQVDISYPSVLLFPKPIM